MDLLEKFIAAAGGHALILTIAPELLGTLLCIDAARKSGLVVGIGHTDATSEQARAVDRGAHHAVRVYNAMRPFTHRDSGVIGAVLTSPDVTTELIADGVHVDDTAMRLLLQAKGAGGVILISDGISATGMPDGKYMLGSFEVTVSGGVCRNAEGELAGHALTLDRALRNIVGLGASLGDALRMLTLNPATLLGIEYQEGALRAGADADIASLMTPSTSRRSGPADERINSVRWQFPGTESQARERTLSYLQSQELPFRDRWFPSQTIPARRRQPSSVLSLWNDR